MGHSSKGGQTTHLGGRETPTHREEDSGGEEKRRITTSSVREHLSGLQAAKLRGGRRRTKVP